MNASITIADMNRECAAIRRKWLADPENANLSTAAMAAKWLRSDERARCERITRRALRAITNTLTFDRPRGAPRGK